MADLSWFVLACAPGAEKRISAYATRHACEPYFPIERRYRPRPQRSPAPREIDEANCTPGYMFVGFATIEPAFHLFRPPAPEPEIADILRRRTFSIGDVFTKEELRTQMAPPPKGVIDFLGRGGRPQRVDQVAIDNLRRREASGEFDYTARRGRHVVPRSMREGSRVVVVDGPFLALMDRAASASGDYPRAIVRRIKNSHTVAIELEDHEILGKRPLINIPIAFLQFAA